MAKQERVFKKGAWLYSIPEELTEEEFIRRAGGIEKVNAFYGYKYVSLILDKGNAELMGHCDGRTISMLMDSMNVKDYQTMEWR